MRRSLTMLAAAAATACGGHTTAPAASAPATARPAPAPSGDPASLRFATGASRYRVEQALHVTQEAMGQTTVIDGTASLVISTSLSAGEAGNLAATFSVDSVTASSTAPGGAAVYEGLRGKTYRAVFSTMGRPVSFASVDTSAIALSGTDYFREFLPQLPSAALAPGLTWTDTSNQTPSNVPAGLTMRTQAIRQHRIVGWEMHDGVRALHIASTGNYTISGSGDAQGQPIQIAGTGATTIERFVSSAGVYLGAVASDSTDLIVTVLSAGIEVPVHQSRHSSVTRLP